MRFFTKRYETWGYTGDYEVIPKKHLRLNTLRAKKIASKFDVTKVKFLDNGYAMNVAFSIPSSPEYLQGEIYLQDAATQVCSEVLNPKEDDVVLDMAAAPGGKTSHLAAIMKNKGVIVALDSVHGRINRLNSNLERLGVTNTIVYQKDAQYVSDLGLEFDKVLLDAPCSGNFSIDKDWFEIRDMEGIMANVRLQKRLLRAAVDVCKTGGEIVYSNCSLEKEEDEDVIEWALEELGVELLPIERGIGVKGITQNTRFCKRIWPGATQGFFLARMKKL